MTSSRKPMSFIATDQPEEAQAFYVDVLGLTLIEANPFALVLNDGVHVLRIQIVQDFSPASYTAYGWETVDIKDEIAALSAKGVQFLQFDQLPQDDAGVWTTPDGHKIAWFSDPGGNILSLTEYADG